MAIARRVAYLAGEALQLAQRDVDASRPQHGPDQWDGKASGAGRRGGSSDLLAAPSADMLSRRRLRLASVNACLDRSRIGE
ncbi:hypothetical protein DCE93_12535 [Agromyces badenianii]|uniref:Uncharacterized protein n=1 Tax=Agromyces badenianii TaxID=2080742 RepID=A0A2S0WYD9_9MICO|nr:hypothetical protein DCE93_12535 [Agromyces badenianii]